MVTRLFHTKFALSDKDVVEIKILEVPESEDFPEGVKYSLVYVHCGERILGYDNERGKGHHKHYKGEEIEIEFKDPETLILNFMDEVKELFEKLS